MLTAVVSGDDPLVAASRTWGSLSMGERRRLLLTLHRQQPLIPTAAAALAMSVVTLVAVAVSAATVAAIGRRLVRLLRRWRSARSLRRRSPGVDCCGGTRSVTVDGCHTMPPFPLHLLLRLLSQQGRANQEARSAGCNFRVDVGDLVVDAHTQEALPHEPVVLRAQRSISDAAATITRLPTVGRDGCGRVPHSLPPVG